MTLLLIKTTINDFKTDAIDKLKSISGSLEKLSEDVNNGFLMVAEIFKKLLLILLLILNQK